ncbi:MAG: hypothetical protein DELT_00762 [Desulfovibrio sp.]
MYVTVGYCDTPDTALAGREAAREALEKANRKEPCDLVLLFATARHNAAPLREAVAEIVGPKAAIVGGGAVGAISNDRFGYAGDQVVLACFWMEKSRFGLAAEGGLEGSEAEVGKKLGHTLAGMGVQPASPVLLFYDAVDRSDDGMRMIMATYLLPAIKEGLGFLPNMNGAGLQGDFLLTPTRQFVGDTIADHNAIALAFDGAVRVDTAIMHGCRPMTGYYTVTKADAQTILEINGTPALEFMNSILGPSIQPEDYPFFLILGVNKGEKWGEFDEESYASRLCLAIDKERGGIVMFEPDMIAGTEFQIMCRSLELGYMPPRIEHLFDNLHGRKPVFALYINCAGRAAGFAGMELEDAPVIQKTLDGRAPLLGIYTGVEIASVEGEPRGLDWTGVFCLFSVPE